MWAIETWNHDLFYNIGFCRWFPVRTEMFAFDQGCLGAVTFSGKKLLPRL
jgi:hypothetical protein